ncbi:MAG: secretin N-terminal domain-containing protein [Elusimicrobiaceae bacterium]|nr:secretin N-terminal domain-containing protein [Elusimicrobiaceae bacterium]
MFNCRLLLAIVLTLQQVLLTPVVYAANNDLDPQFQQDLQGGSSGAVGGGDDTFSMPKNTTPGTPIEISGSKVDDPLYEKKELHNPLDAKVTVRAKEMPLSAFLEIISSQARVNFIVTEGLQAKTVTAILNKVSVREALEILLQVRGLTYQRIGTSNTYVIAKRSVEAPNLVTKIYTLNYISLISIGSNSSELSSITASIAPSSGGMMGGMGGMSGSSGSGNSGAMAGGADSGIAILNVLRTVLSTRGQLAIEPRTNSLIVTDIAEVFPQVEQIIAELDRKAPQVLIEAKIIEINTDRVNELGIDWGGNTGELATYTGPVRDTDFPLGERSINNGDWKMFPSESSVNGSISTPGYLSLAQLQVTLRALVSRAEARYLGNTKIVTLNNKTAIITNSREQAVGTSQSVSDAGGGTSTSSIERANTGLKLTVTPQVNKEGYITLMVQPSYSDVKASAISSSESVSYDPVSRGASTLVRVKNGQAVVIGGLLSSSDNKTVRKVPLLGYIPILGWLFTSVSHTRSNTDLVIIITPTILVD